MLNKPSHNDELDNDVNVLVNIDLILAYTVTVRLCLKLC